MESFYIGASVGFLVRIITLKWSRFPLTSRNINLYR